MQLHEIWIQQSLYYSPIYTVYLNMHLYLVVHEGPLPLIKSDGRMQGQCLLVDRQSGRGKNRVRRVTCYNRVRLHQLLDLYERGDRKDQEEKTFICTDIHRCQHRHTQSDTWSETTDKHSVRHAAGKPSLYFISLSLSLCPQNSAFLQWLPQSTITGNAHGVYAHRPEHRDKREINYTQTDFSIYKLPLFFHKTISLLHKITLRLLYNQ